MYCKKGEGGGAGTTPSAGGMLTPSAPNPSPNISLPGGGSNSGGGGNIDIPSNPINPSIPKIEPAPNVTPSIP